MRRITFITESVLTGLPTCRLPVEAPADPGESRGHRSSHRAEDPATTAAGAISGLPKSLERLLRGTPLPGGPAARSTPAEDRVWHRVLIRLVRFRAWLLGGVFTAGSVAIVTRPSGEILLVRPRYRQGWGLVGGFVRAHEQPEDAMNRELAEEVGITAQVSPPIAVYAHERRRHIDHLFVISVDADAVQGPAARYEIAAMSWRPLEDLPPLQEGAQDALERWMSISTGEEQPGRADIGRGRAP